MAWLVYLGTFNNFPPTADGLWLLCDFTIHPGHLPAFRERWMDVKLLKTTDWVSRTIQIKINYTSSDRTGDELLARTKLLVNYDECGRK